MRILFLDIDGVLNSSFYLHGKPRKTWPFEHIDPAAVQLLNKVVRETDCKIVISSSWRIILPYWVLRMVLACRGFEFASHIIDQTPRHGFDNRGMEIQAWLNKRPDVSRFVIVDDDMDMAHLMPKLVKTSWHSGLTIRGAELIIKGLTSDQTPDRVET
jgi:hypothetical protein